MPLIDCNFEREPARSNSRIRISLIETLSIASSKSDASLCNGLVDWQEQASGSQRESLKNSTRTSHLYSPGSSLLMRLFGTLLPATPQQFYNALTTNFCRPNFLDSVALLNKLQNFGSISSCTLDETIFKGAEHQQTLQFSSSNCQILTKWLDQYHAVDPKSQTMLGIQYARCKMEPLAFKWFKCAADARDPVAMYNISYCYKRGLGIEKDFLLHIEWLERAADSGQPVAQNDLGMYHASGKLVAKDSRRALELLKLSAEQGEPTAMYNLAYFHEMGINCDQDMATAKKWYIIAAEKGDAQACYRVAKMYSKGHYLPADLDRAVHFYTVAAKKRHASACHELALHLLANTASANNAQAGMDLMRTAAQMQHTKSLHQLGKLYSRPESSINEQKDAILYFKRAAAQGSVDSMYELAKLYDEIFDFRRALKYFLKSARRRHPEAAFRVGSAYHVGHGCEENHTTAFEWYQTAANLGNSEAQYALGKMYQLGVFPAPKDAEKAIELYTSSSNLKNHKATVSLALVNLKTGDYKAALPRLIIASTAGLPEAQFHLGIAYQLGNLVTQDYSKAFDLLYSSSNADYLDAIFAVGLCYLRGLGTTVQPELAYKAFERAAKHTPKAQHQCGEAYRNGNGVEMNYYTAIEWFRKAAEHDFPPSLYCLGRAYVKGEGVPQHFGHATFYLEKAVVADYQPAQMLLAMLLVTGHRVRRNTPHAIELFEKCAVKGDVVAMNQLGICMLEHHGDHVAARKWFKKAAELGYEPSKANLIAL